MKRILLLMLMAVAAAVVSVAANAMPAQPADEVISSITEQVLAQSAALGSAADPARLRSFIETAVMPRLDFRAMTARAVGPRWRTATDEQKARLMAGFESLLIKTYAGAFAQAAGARYKMKQSIPLDATSFAAGQSLVPDLGCEARNGAHVARM
jgi:phospholipid transport system substrate-binding protein